jgi:arsenate reductase
METDIPSRLATLGHPQRLAIFRLLMRRYPDAVAAGELADALGLRPSTLSAYLAALMRAGLVTQARAGTSLRYAIDLAQVRGTFEYLLNDCCRGRPDICAPATLAKGGLDMGDRKYNVLFICVGNSARSIFAETILRDMAGDRFTAWSAGTRPSSALNPAALALLAAKGHDIAPLRAKHVDAFRAEGAPVMDFVFTVCDRAANEECPPWQGQPVTAHWGTPDPVRATGTEAQRALAFQHAYGALRNRISIFAALPFESLDRLGLQAAVDDIGSGAGEGTA